MESPAAQNSRKRVFPGGSSSCHDIDVVEIAPPTNWSSNSRAKSLKRKEVTQVMHRQVIYIDSDDDLDDPVVIDSVPHVSNNGKKPAKMSHNNMATHIALDDEQFDDGAFEQSHHDANGTGSSHFLRKRKSSPSSSSLRTQVAISPEKILGADGSGNSEQTLIALQRFKQFDTVEDHSDHYFYIKNGSRVPQQPKNWAKRIQEEWKILEKGLPDTIFVRVYESRMDLLRAAIIGAQGTPYHDGLFFFDIFFPSAYPAIPPHVYYHSGGLRINPNLYNCGKVCLSLLNTWAGNGNEKWIPHVSTMLQVLVSIQALILNEKPYFNEPGFASSAGSPTGERNSKQYSENTFLLSLKTMVYTMRKPPMHFKEIVLWHFVEHAQKILGACQAYIEKEVPVGDQNEKAKGRRKKCSKIFKKNVASHITMVIEAFVQIGVKDTDKYLALAQKGD